MTTATFLQYQKAIKVLENHDTKITQKKAKEGDSSTWGALVPTRNAL